MRMLRRQLLLCFGGIVASRLANSQSSPAFRRIGILVGTASDSLGQAQLAALRESLNKLGWIEGQNIEVIVGWGEGKLDLIQTQVEALIKGKSAVIGVSTATALREMQRAAGKTPIVFWGVSDPVGNKFVNNLARPGDNITGFSLFEYEVGGKWLQLLTEAAPKLKRVLLLMNAANPNRPGWVFALDRDARTLGLELVKPNVTDPTHIEPAIAEFGREPNGGLLVLPDPFIAPVSRLVVNLATRYRLPAVYGVSRFAEGGGLIYYGIDQTELARRAALYISRILHGEKPGDLPVQAPTVFELVINNKTARALGLRFPQSMLLRANRVIE